MNFKNRLITLLLLSTTSYANPYSDFSKNMLEGNYVKACKDGKKIISSNEKDEKIIITIGQVCLKADYIDTIGVIQSRLRDTKEARENSVIFSAMLLEKRLIYQFMYDDTDISTLALPVTNHPLSKTFIAIRDKNYKVISTSPKVITFKDGYDSYKVYIDTKQKGRIIIEITSKDNKISKHRYL